MLLAELIVRHTRRHMPTRRVALESAYLPTSGPAHGVALLAAVVATNLPAVDDDERELLARLVDDARGGLSIPRIALRHRLQRDVHGLDRSRHRLLGEDGQLVLELDAHGAQIPQVLGAVMGAAWLPSSGRAVAIDALRRVVKGRWGGLAPDVEVRFVAPDMWDYLRPPLAAAGEWHAGRPARGGGVARRRRRPALGDGGARAARRHGRRPRRREPALPAAAPRRPSRQRRRGRRGRGAHRRAHRGPHDPARPGFVRGRGPGLASPSMKQPVRVAVTGAAGQIGYSLLFRIANGDLLGPDQPVILQLLEITPALPALGGVVMELADCAFPLLAGVVTTDDANAAFDGVNYALLVGSRPRTKGMERKELLEVNGAIFTAQGKALAAGAADDVRVLVVGNPANTNCLIAMNNAGSIPRERFTAMTRLDHNRAQGAARGEGRRAGRVGHAHDDLGQPLGDAVPRRVPRRGRRQARGRARVDQAWIEKDFIPTVQQRGAAIIEARGSSSAASAANAALDHVRDWALGTPAGDWVSMAVPSDGSYGVPEGLISGFPCTTKNGVWSIVPGLDIDDFSRAASTRRSPSSAKSATPSRSSA